MKFLESNKWNWESKVQLESQEENDDINDHLVKGTRLLFDIYERYNVALMEPSGYKEAATYKKWIVAMKEGLNMIEKIQPWELVDKPKTRSL